mmetsp:Transcript_85919/g.229206  ORF Transcript_85919/g.229206 Transcript_85919/m.229206 type:complete len:185 (-) Transcript_85919:795-1349(-)
MSFLLARAGLLLLEIKIRLNRSGHLCASLAFIVLQRVLISNLFRTTTSDCFRSPFYKLHPVMSRSSRPQDKNRYIHPKETSSWKEEIKVFDYVCTGNFRIVPPYHYEFGSSIKARWIGRKLVEVFAQEFPHFDDSTSYFEEAMRKGRLRVNDEVTDVNYRCSDGDVITHFVHRLYWLRGEFERS